jgi:hypothetical protein
LFVFRRSLLKTPISRLHCLLRSCFYFS